MSMPEAGLASVLTGFCDGRLGGAQVRVGVGSASLEKKYKVNKKLRSSLTTCNKLVSYLHFRREKTGREVTSNLPRSHGGK